MRILIAAALLASSASVAAAAPCNQGPLTGRWLLSSAAGNSCNLTIAADGTYEGRCTGPSWQRRGGPVEGTLRVNRRCLVNGEISGEARNGSFGPLAVGPAALAQDGFTAHGVTNTGDGNQRHGFDLVKLP
jgi:hypothetical protein